MISLAFLFGLASLAPAMAAQPVGSGAEVAIDYAVNGGIRDYYAEDERAIYLRDRTGRWYKATFTGICPNLLTEGVVGFESDALGRLDRFGAVVTRSGRCALSSVVRSVVPRDKGKP